MFKDIKYYEEIIKAKEKFLSDEECEQQEVFYNSIVKEFFPGLEDLNQKEYAYHKEQEQLGSNDSKQKIKDCALMTACESLIEYYLYLNIDEYNFKDALQDIYLLIDSRYDVYTRSNFVSEFKFYVKTTVVKTFIYQLKKYLKSNMDVKMAFEGGKRETCVDSVIKEDVCFAENEVLYREFKEDVNKFIYKLPAKSVKLLTMYYGLNGHEQMTMDEIANYYKVSRADVQSLIKKTFKKINAIKRSEEAKEIKNGIDF